MTAPVPDQQPPTPTTAPTGSTPGATPGSTPGATPGSTPGAAGPGSPDPAATGPTSPGADAAPQAPDGAASYEPPAGREGARPTPSPVAVPVAPRSRIGAHVISTLAGLVLVPLGLSTLAAGADGVATALEAAEDPSVLTLVLCSVSAALLGIVAWVAGASTFGPLVAGGVFALAPGIGFLLAPATTQEWTTRILEPLDSLTGGGLLDGALTLGRTGSLVLLGLTLVLVGAAAHVARRAGRRVERTEALLAPVPYPAPPPVRGAANPITPPTPPRSRAPAHVAATAAALVLGPVGLALTAAGTVDLALATADGAAPDLGTVLWPWACGLVVLAAITLSAGWSTLGLFLAGTLFGVVPGVLGLFSPATTSRGVGAFLAWVGDVVDPDAAAGLYALATLGILLTWGAVAAFGAVGTHLARRDGRRRERAEIAVARATAARTRL